MSPRKAGRRRLYPMPIEGLVDHPIAMSAPPSVYGSICRLTLHWWVTYPEPMPTGDAELRNLARTSAKVWLEHKHRILQVLSDIKPAMEGYWRMRTGSERGLANARLQARLTLAKTKRNAAKPQPAPDNTSPRAAAIALAMPHTRENASARHPTQSPEFVPNPGHFIQTPTQTLPQAHTISPKRQGLKDKLPAR